MPGKFVMGRDVVREAADWGSVGWLCRPSITGAANLAIVEATFGPGKGHAFHKHPEQEEVIFVVAGEVEQWIGEDKRNLRPGDSAFIPADVVHATFVIGAGEARILAIFGPVVGEGSTTDEMAHLPPWNTLRGEA